VDQGYELICPLITSRHSGTFATAQSAALSFGGHVTVVDSLSLAWGLGMQAVHAARMALEGACKEAILEKMRSVRMRTHVIFVINTLEYLRRGGRVARVMPTIDRLARALQLKPVMNFVDGEVRLLGVARSYQKGVARSYQKGLERIKAEVMRVGLLETLIVMHARRVEAARAFASDLSGATNIPRERIRIDEVGAVLSSHAGEGVMAAIAVGAG
jgi:DegV family protein with EDD domain